MIESSSNSDVARIHSDRSVGNLSVFELAVADVISRGLKDESSVQAILSGIFLRQVRIPDIVAASDGLVRMGLVHGEETLAARRLTVDGIEAVITMKAAMIRLFDLGTGVVLMNNMLGMFNFTTEEGHDGQDV